MAIVPGGRGDPRRRDVGPDCGELLARLMQLPTLRPMIRGGCTACARASGEASASRTRYECIMKTKWNSRLVGWYGALTLVLAGYAVWMPRKADIAIQGSGDVRTIIRIDDVETTRLVRAPTHITVPSTHFIIRVLPAAGQPIRVTAQVRSATRAGASAAIASNDELSIRVAGANILAW